MFLTCRLTDSLFTLSYPEDFVNNFFIVFYLSFYDCLPFLAVSLFILSSEHIIVNMFFNFLSTIFVHFLCALDSQKTFLYMKHQKHSNQQQQIIIVQLRKPYTLIDYLIGCASPGSITEDRNDQK